MSCLIVMSQKEFNRLEICRGVRQGSLTVTRAAALRLSRSQVHRLFDAGAAEAACRHATSTEEDLETVSGTGFAEMP